MFCKKSILRNFAKLTGKHLCQNLFLSKVEMTDKKIPSTDLVEMAEFILKNHLFEFETKIIQQISGTATGTKFAPPYA